MGQSLFVFHPHLIDRDKRQMITRMRGKPGYLAFEWLTSQITEKADVYSFGAVVMEIISGRKNLDTSGSEMSIHLITFGLQSLRFNSIFANLDRGYLPLSNEVIQCREGRRPRRRWVRHPTGASMAVAGEDLRRAAGAREVETPRSSGSAGRRRR